MKKLNDTFVISKRGWLLIALVGVLFLFFSVTALHLFQYLFGAMLIALLIIFRNPERGANRAEVGAIVSPADGIVLTIEDRNIDGIEVKKIVILNTLWDVSILRSPCDCSVDGVKFRTGASLSLFNPLSEQLNEKCVISFKTPHDSDIYVEHIGEKNCFKLAVDLEKSQELSLSERYGFLSKGRTSIYLPQNSRVAIEVGASLKAGESIVGYFA